MSQAKPVCDFCSSPDVRWRYRCPDFSQRIVTIDVVRSASDVIDWGSGGDWAACPVCHELIERDDRKRLARRSARRFQRKTAGSLSLKEMESLIRAHQAEFFRRRVGDAIPVTNPTEGR